jgi:hypothetical protein
VFTFISSELADFKEWQPVSPRLAEYIVRGLVAEIEKQLQQLKVTKSRGTNRNPPRSLAGQNIILLPYIDASTVFYNESTTSFDELLSLITKECRFFQTHT